MPVLYTASRFIWPSSNEKCFWIQSSIFFLICRPLECRGHYLSRSHRLVTIQTIWWTSKQKWHVSNELHQPEKKLGWRFQSFRTSLNRIVGLNGPLPCEIFPLHFLSNLLCLNKCTFYMFFTSLMQNDLYV